MSVYSGIAQAAHRAVRAVLGHAGTLTVDGTAYSVQVVLWEPGRQLGAPGDLAVVDAQPTATFLAEDIDATMITPHQDTLAIDGRTWSIESARADGLGRVRLTLAGG